jgi:serine/threonine protein kinase
MERMAAPLSEVVNILHESYGKAGKGVVKIPFGDVPVAMFDCIRAMHDNGNLFIDVKPENFMLGGVTDSSIGKKRGSKQQESLGQRVRLIDFGLVERYDDMSMSKHRINNFPNALLIGTPTYASLNIMEGNTPSRRDDLEALGYVISELILILASAGAGTSGKGADRRKNEDDHVLPWSHASSDVELRQIKSREMDESRRSTSALFAGLKSAGADVIMGNYFSTVRGLAYAETPDYDSIRSVLMKLVVTTKGAKETSHDVSPMKTKKSPPLKTSARRKHVDDESNDSVEVVDENILNRKSSGKIQKVSVAKESVVGRTTKSTSKSSCEVGTQTDEIDGDYSDSMDWEPVENATSNRSDGTSDNDAKRKGVLKLCVVEGPHAGHEISFGGDHLGTVCVGRNPASRAMKDAIKFAVSKDKSASSVHAKFVINSKSNVHSVRVTDMASSNSTFVNGTCLPNGKSRQAFVGDKIMIGESLIEIKKA